MEQPDHGRDMDELSGEVFSSVRIKGTALAARTLYTIQPNESKHPRKRTASEAGNNTAVSLSRKTASDEPSNELDLFGYNLSSAEASSSRYDNGSFKRRVKVGVRNAEERATTCT